MLFWPIIYASVITAILIAPTIHLLGIRWRWSFLIAFLLAAGIGWSALRAAAEF